MTRLPLLILAAIGAVATLFAAFCVALGWLSSRDLREPEEVFAIPIDTYLGALIAKAQEGVVES